MMPSRKDPGGKTLRIYYKSVLEFRNVKANKEPSKQVSQLVRINEWMNG